MSSMLLPFRLAAVAGLALILSMTSASAAEDVAAKEPAVAAAPVAADKPAAVASATTEKPATDLGAARAAADKRAAAPAPRVIRRAAPPQHALSCSGIWCGRQFVLMLGTAY